MNNYDPGQEAADAFHANQVADKAKRRRDREHDAAGWVRASEIEGFPLGEPQTIGEPNGRGRLSIWVASSGLTTGRCQLVNGYAAGAYVVYKSHLDGSRDKWLITHVATGMFVHNPVWVGLGTDDQRLVHYGMEKTKRAAMALAARLPALLTDQPFGVRGRDGFKIVQTDAIRKDLGVIKAALTTEVSS